MSTRLTPRGLFSAITLGLCLGGCGEGTPAPDAPKDKMEGGAMAPKGKMEGGAMAPKDKMDGGPMEGDKMAPKDKMEGGAMGAGKMETPPK